MNPWLPLAHIQVAQGSWPFDSAPVKIATHWFVEITGDPPQRVLLTSAPTEDHWEVAAWVWLRLIKRLAVLWKESQQVLENGWTRLELAWANTLMAVHRRSLPRESFFLAPPRIQVWWDQKLVPAIPHVRADWRPDPQSLATFYWGRFCPCPPDDDHIRFHYARGWLPLDQTPQAGPEGSKFIHRGGTVAHSKDFPIHAYIVAYALTLMERLP